jgi:hypothetical protein
VPPDLLLPPPLPGLLAPYVCLALSPPLRLVAWSEAVLPFSVDVWVCAAQCPVYSPYRVRLELHPPPPTVPLASPSSQSGPLYVSPSYDVQSIMRVRHSHREKQKRRGIKAHPSVCCLFLSVCIYQEQSFVLPRPVWCSGNMIRVVLEGKATRQTLGTHPSTTHIHKTCHSPHPLSVCD